MDFEQKLMTKYPDLFYKREDGTPYCPCGVGGRTDWEPIIEDLCGSIDSYMKNVYRLEREVTGKMYYFWALLEWLVRNSHLRFTKLFPKYNKWEYNKPIFHFIHQLSNRKIKHCKWNKIHCPPVKIDQIKEKFHTLRFYYSGGDKEVAGMVSFAEYLCNKKNEN
jgi:hypothetical protein